MAEEPHNLILEHLRAIRGSQERMEHDIKDLKFRVGQIEQTLAHHSSRFDRVEARLEHIEKRLGLVDA
jgi:predicted  nucleic acid-binding Zn-ribbon protein